MLDFALLSSHTVFPPGIDISTLQLTSRTVWPEETTVVRPTHITMSTPEGSHVRCPLGEPGKPNDGGYSLKLILGWNSARYKSVRASHSQVLFYI